LLHRGDHWRPYADRLQPHVLVGVEAAHHHDRAHEFIGAGAGRGDANLQAMNAPEALIDRHGLGDAEPLGG
jgi:hypothetical protein